MMIDSTNIAFMVDTVNNESCIHNHEMLRDFNFVSEQSSCFEGPKEREVTYISASWNFAVLFVVLILMVLNKFLVQQRDMSASFYNRGELAARESNSFINIQSLFVVISFALLVSMFVQKIFLIFGGNYLLHSHFGFFVDVLISVLTLFIFNYLFTSFYGWIFKVDNLIFLHVNSHITSMSSCNLLLMPIILLLFFHPYKFFLIIAAVIILSFYIAHSVKLLMETRMLLKVNFVNIFLYLCTTEILPVLVIFKMIMNII